MSVLWLLRGAPDAPGWDKLQADSMQQKINVISFDRDRWALIKDEDPPRGYEGLTPSEPPDGVYLDGYGRPVFVLGRREVHSGRVVVEALGDEARQLLDRVGDPVMVLDRLGRSY
jgi:hypothetical protein